MIYFDNAATSFPKAPGVTDRITDFITHQAANPGRAGHRLAVQAEQMIDDVRLQLTRLFDGDDFHRMIFTLNCTDALNMAIKGVLPIGASGTSNNPPHVITTDLEHNSVSRPLQAMADQGQIKLTRIGFDDAGFVNPADIEKSITPDTKLIVMTHAANVLGTIQDVAAVGAIARKHDVLFLLDGAQTAGIVPISIKQMQVDLLAFPGHKSLLGPTGIGGLYIGDRVPDPTDITQTTNKTCQNTNAFAMRPWREGGTGGDSATPTQPAIFPFYLEGGTPNTVGIAGLQASLQYLAKQEMANTLAHEQQLVQMIFDRFANDDRFIFYGSQDSQQHVGTLALNIQGYDCSDVSSILDDSFEIAVRSGLHCSPYTHKRLGTFPDGALRISPGPFNTVKQLNTLLDALHEIAG